MSTVHRGQWDAAIDRLYAAVGVEQELAGALGMLRPFFDARAVTFLTAPVHPTQQSMHIASCDVPPRSLVEYHSHYFLYDEWVNAARAGHELKEGVVFRGTDLVPQHELMRSYFWKKFLAPHGIVDILCAVTEAGGVGMPTSFVTFHRMQGQEPYSQSSAALLAELAPHLRRVLRLHRRLAPQIAVGATLHELFQLAEAPMLFVSSDGQEVERNAAATRHMERPKPLLRSISGALSYRDGREWRALSAALGAAQPTSQSALDLLIHDGAGTVMHLSARRVHGAATDVLAKHESAFICTLHPAGAEDEAALKLRFGFSDAEARVARMLAAGEAPADIAAVLAVAISTVRTHMAALFVKTRTRRQPELVARLLEAKVY